MNKIEQDMKREKLLNWFVEKHRDRVYKLAVAESRIKNKNMPWYKKMLYNNDIYQWIKHRTAELLVEKFNNDYEVQENE